MMKTIECLTQVILTDGDANVTNHPGSVLSLPVNEADALIEAGKAKEYIDPATEQNTPPVEARTDPAETVSAGSRFSETQ